MELTDREVTLAVAGLATLNHDFESADSEVSREAWKLAQQIAEGHDVGPETAVRQLR